MEIPKYIDIALNEYGIIEGVNTARIVEYDSATDLKATQDSVPWCSAFVCWVMQSAGYKHTNSAAARSWLTYGFKLDEFMPYCIVVMQRAGDKTKGHVGFGISIRGGQIYILGGNENNMVMIKPYNLADVIEYRATSDQWLDNPYTLG